VITSGFPTLNPSLRNKDDDPATLVAGAKAQDQANGEQLQKAGVLLALDGLHPPSMGARVTFKGGKSKVTDSPFTESKEVVGGYWLIQVKSREEALEMGLAHSRLGQ